MTVARITEISATSKTGFEDAVKQGLKRAHETLRNVKGAWVKEQEQLLAQRYERELMNPDEALSLGSISQIVMPSDLRQVLAEHMDFCLRHYRAQPMQAVQREFH